MTGRQLRLHRLFPPGGGLIVALDHGLFQGRTGGPRAPFDIVKDLTAEPVTGFLVSRGVWELLPDNGYHKGLLLRVDASTSFPAVPDTVRVTSPACALRLGADGILTMGMFCRGDNNRLLKEVGLLTEEAHANGLPAVIEFMPAPDGLPVQDALRISAELGFDAAKIFWPGDREVLAELIAESPIPVAVAGGQALASGLTLLELVGDVRKSGAAGLIFGRNIWGHPRPRAVVRAINAVWQGNLAPAEAYEHYLAEESEED